MEVQFGVVTLAVLALSALLAFLPKRLRLPLLIALLVLVLLVAWLWPEPTAACGNCTKSSTAVPGSPSEATAWPSGFTA